MKWLSDLGNSFKRLPQIVIHPRRYFSQFESTWLDGYLVIFLLLIATFLQKLVWAASPVTPWQAAKDTLLNTLLSWSIYCALFGIIVVVFKKQVTLRGFLSVMGSAGMPLLATTLLSVLGWIVADAGAFPVTPAWLAFQDGLSWLGIVLSWPGWLGAHLLRDRFDLPVLWSILLPAVMLLVVIAGSLVPALIR